MIFSTNCLVAYKVTKPGLIIIMDYRIMDYGLGSGDRGSFNFAFFRDKH